MNGQPAPVAHAASNYYFVSFEIEGPATVSITAPANGAILGYSDDLDKNTPELQYEVALTDANVPNPSGKLTTGERTYDFVAPTGAGGATTRQVSLSDGVHTLLARVQDACGNPVASTPVTVSVSVRA